MDIEHCLKLTLAVYRVTELFPEEEPLKQQIRESASKILSGLLTDENGSRRFIELKEFFDLAKVKKIVDPRNFLVLQKEYDKIGKLFNQATVPYPKFFKERHKKIINIMKEKDQIQVRELRQIFPDISRRTLIRDLEELFQSGIVVRTGSGRGVHYSHKL